MIERKGNDVDKLDISGNLKDHKLQRRQSNVEKTKKQSLLSDNYLMPLQKARRSATKEDKVVTTTTAATTVKTSTTGKPIVNKTTAEPKKKPPIRGIEPIPITSYSNGTYSFFVSILFYPANFREGRLWSTFDTNSKKFYLMNTACSSIFSC